MIQSKILEELVDRWLTKVATLVAIFITFRGHNAPGGGFAGGLILGAAFVLQYLAGQQPMVRRRPILRPERLLGAGLLLALVTTIAPLFVGGSPLESYIWTVSLPQIGKIKVVSSMFFDFGVFFVVVAVVLIVLSFFGVRGQSVVKDSSGGAA
jgi:multicomponent Na+:H+ antiporter subunit A